MKRSFDASRRRFLATASALSAVGPTVAPFALNLAAIGSAAAQSTCSASDYKALVCIYLGGGNDAYNMVIPTDDASFEAYRAARDQLPSSLLIARGGSGYDAIGLNPRVPLPGDRPIALHPEMTHAAALFDAGRLAIVPNVGPLLVPIPTAADVRTLGSQRLLPSRLYSHSDQRSTWMAFAPEGEASRGWGGRLGDLFASCNGTRSNFTAISATGNVLFLAGDATLQYQVGSGGAVTVPNTSGALYGATNGGATLARIAGRVRADDHLILREQASTTKRSIELGTDLNSMLVPSASVAATPRWASANESIEGAGVNYLADQLRVVARIIGGASKPASGIKRQVFMVSLGGFDTHDGQRIAHARLLGRVSQALEYFNTLLATPEINAVNAVTTFTASEFGRTFSSNGDGTDHGWGGHHFVMGGAIDGGKVHGVMPVVGPASNRTWVRGSMIPAISVDQYAGHLARWFGASPTDIATLFPNLSRFPGSASPSFFKS